MKGGELMQEDVVTVTPETSLKDVARALVEHRISGLPVCGADSCVLGVVTEGDILYKERGRVERSSGPLAWLVDGTRYDEVAKAWARTAGEAMTAPAVTITPERPAAEAARRMIENRVNRLVVINGAHRLVGIVSRADLVRAFIRSDATIVEEIRADVLKRVLWVEPERVQIVVRNGEVELGGELETRADVDVLVRLVEKIPGVMSVRSTVGHRVELRGRHRTSRPPAVKSS